MKVLIDNGHGENTPGKRSPDGRLRECSYTREIADLVVVGLRKKGIDAERIVKEDSDVPLSERCRRANNIYRNTGKKAILVSIHCNAAGSGANWMNAQGWSAFVSNNASLNSKKLAESLAQVAEYIPVPIRKPMPGQLYWQQNLAICRDTNCPAVLTENFFQDNKEDVEYLLSPAGKQVVVQIHIDGIIKYLEL
ncbi:N-acetylmuramoyl-L-alanine amidase [Bacteroides thetaiotaomicron]|uniref:N-acetylmuramoyl-L-alanine amidase n=1 Tax=Bacteroides thetaiotaomicron TaxID=818 RepID=UPI001C392166|nr:N-acetylmuramoyl-L-alanine amidase [Bacteroides thetaiotaomicron]MBV4308802.1 N-acetylmuramoyl-L-alanine amidase [Bacteroides thetaiotaomicron]MBV4330518.1 N-acetylmuramoyl-L-alanine amidase [Bacteroides thetaiotaomicron]MCB7384468.1 N-acetylmuramoyl-L-alanine amidase [Bacteroides thetaiotaomicron]MCG4884565.1 N-acetylmuramoyl-L-alanine amidase [Bacteroides thetaiotaomicron]MCQ5247671.1 N-acetylmuramoyl-L-alanine amidase [Bacteroides thetaiotaomicron]